MCVRAKEKKKKNFFSRKTYTRIIVIELIIVKLFGVIYPVVFPFKRNDFSRKFCVFVCDCYFGLLILLIISFGTNNK